VKEEGIEVIEGTVHIALEVIAGTMNLITLLLGASLNIFLIASSPLLTTTCQQIFSVAISKGSKFSMGNQVILLK